MTTGVRGLAMLVVAIGLGACGEKDGAGADREAERMDEAPAGHVLAREDHRLPDGAVVTARHALHVTEAAMTMAAGGARRVGTMTMKIESERRIEMVSATKRRLVVVKDEQSVTRAIDAVPEKSPSTGHALRGEAVSFERVEGKWVGTLEGGEASEAQQAAIDSLGQDLGNREAAGMFGTEPRRVGEEWEVDPQNASVLGDGADFAGKYRLRFDRIEEFGGERCAVLVGAINVRGQPAAEGGGGAQIEIVAEATIFRSLDDLVNRRMAIAGTLVMREDAGRGESVVVRGPLKIVRESVVTMP